MCCGCCSRNEFTIHIPHVSTAAPRHTHHLHLHLQKDLGQAVAESSSGAVKLRFEDARAAAAAAAAGNASDTAAIDACDVLVQHVKFAVVMALRDSG